VLIADDYIKKPIEIKELKTRIDNVLKKSKKK
jgi:DNA-binding response OmpR family regulator